MVITVSLVPVSGTLHAGNSKRYASIADRLNAVSEGLLRISWIRRCPLRSSSIRRRQDRRC